MHTFVWSGDRRPVGRVEPGRAAAPRGGQHRRAAATLTDGRTAPPAAGRAQAAGRGATRGAGAQAAAGQDGRCGARARSPRAWGRVAEARGGRSQRTTRRSMKRTLERDGAGGLGRILPAPCGVLLFTLFHESSICYAVLSPPPSVRVALAPPLWRQRPPSPATTRRLQQPKRAPCNVRTLIIRRQSSWRGKSA